MRSQSASAQGRSVRNDSGPAAIKKPSVLCVLMTPPTRSAASSRVTSTGWPDSRLNSTRRCAAARPAMPPPTMVTRFRVAWASTILLSACVLPHQVGQHANERGVVIHRGGAGQCDAQSFRDLTRLDIEIVEHLGMVTDKADRGDDDIGFALRRQVANDSADIGFEP